MIKIRNLALVLSFMAYAMPNIANAEEHVVNAAAREFKPAIVYVQPGDTVKFLNMTSHNAVTYLVPEGATGWGQYEITATAGQTSFSGRRNFYNTSN